MVEQVLTKHLADIYAAARELGVSGPDLKRLTWSKPKLLERAHEEMELLVLRVQGMWIQMLDSDDPRQRERAADRILSSSLAFGHPLSPAHRGRESNSAPVVEIKFLWAGDGDKVKPGEGE